MYNNCGYGSYRGRKFYRICWNGDRTHFRDKYCQTVKWSYILQEKIADTLHKFTQEQTQNKSPWKWVLRPPESISGAKIEEKKLYFLTSKSVLESLKVGFEASRIDFMGINRRKKVGFFYLKIGSGVSESGFWGLQNRFQGQNSKTKSSIFWSQHRFWNPWKWVVRSPEWIPGAKIEEKKFDFFTSK